MDDEELMNEEDQPEELNSLSPKKQEKLSFIKYLQKTQSNREKKKKEGKDKTDGLQGTPITTWKRNVVHDEPINSVMARHYRDVFEEAREEEAKEEEEER